MNSPASRCLGSISSTRRAQVSVSSYFRWCQYQIGDLHEDQCRSRIAREGLLLEPQALVESPERLLQRPVQQQRFRVIRIDLERPAQASLRRRPIPLAEKQHTAQGDLRVRAVAVHGQGPQRRRLRLAERLLMRHRTKSRLGAACARQPGVRRRIRGIDRQSGAKRVYGSR